MSFGVQIGESTSQREYEAIGCSDEGIWKGLAWPIVSSIFQKVLVEAGTSEGLMGLVDDGDFLIWLRRETLHDETEGLPKINHSAFE